MLRLHSYAHVGVMVACFVRGYVQGAGLSVDTVDVGPGLRCQGVRMGGWCKTSHRVGYGAQEDCCVGQRSVALGFVALGFL